MKIAAVQMVSTPRVDDNLDSARRLVARAAGNGATLVALPEYFCLMGLDDRDKLGVAEGPGDGPIQGMLAATAREFGVWLIAGTLPIRTPGGERVRNASCVYAPDGRHHARYDKIHLFRFDSGGERYDEATTLVAGRTPTVFDLSAPAQDPSAPARDPNAPARGSAPARGPSASARDAAAPQAWRIGLSVCYDLRFPELYRAMAPADLILAPSAFTWATGSAHWELLLRARAVENQCYLLAPAQGGVHENGRRTWGHSMLVDPWGEVVAVRAEDGAGVVVGEVTRARLKSVRAGLPALSHRVM